MKRIAVELNTMWRAASFRIFDRASASALCLVSFVSRSVEVSHSLARTGLRRKQRIDFFPTTVSAKRRDNPVAHPLHPA